MKIRNLIRINLLHICKILLLLLISLRGNCSTQDFIITQIGMYFDATNLTRSGIPYTEKQNY